MEIHFSIGKRVRHYSGAEGSDHSEAKRARTPRVTEPRKRRRLKPERPNV